MVDYVPDEQCERFRENIYDRIHDNWKTLIGILASSILVTLGISVTVAGCSIQAQNKVSERLTRVETRQEFVIDALQEIKEDVKHIKKNGNPKP